MISDKELVDELEYNIDQVNKRDVRIKELKEDVRRLEKEWGASQKKLDGKGEHVDKLKSEAAALRANRAEQVFALKDALNSEIAKNEEQANKINELQLKNNNLCDQLESQVEVSLDTADRLRVEEKLSDSWREEFEAAMAKLNEVTNENEEMRSAVDEACTVRAKYSAAADKVLALQGQLEAMEAELMDVNGANCEYQDTISDLTQELEDKSLAINEECAEKEDVKRRVGQLELILNNMTVDLKEAMRELNESEVSNQQAIRDLARSADMFEDLKESYDKVAEELASTYKANEELKSTCEVYRSAVSNMAGKVEMLKDLLVLEWGHE